MLPYWLLFGYFAAGALLAGDKSIATQRTSRLFLLFGAVIVTLMIGLRYRVGADWTNYEFIYSYAKYLPFERLSRMGDPGYMLLNWAAYSLDVGLWAVNLVCGAIFTWGLLKLAKAQPAPWLAMLIAVPYLIIVVAMGYSRQGVAIGILMAGLASLDRNFSILRFALYIAAAALFHRTAIIALPIVMFASQRNKLLNILVAGLTFWLLFSFFLQDALDTFVENYIQKAYSSQGAAIRVVMSVVPAVIYLSAQNRFGFSQQQKVVWRYFAFAAIALLVLLMTTPSSTAIDRLALYVIPLQIVILSRLPEAYLTPSFGKVLVVGYSAAILFVWLNFAVHSQGWVPYRIYPLGGL